MPKPIPKEWRVAVIRSLRTYDDHIVEWTSPAFQRWKTDSFGAWKHEAYDGMIVALEDDSVEGNETTSMPGQLATYEFLFHHASRPMYGKIALRQDRSKILILSAHRREKPTLGK
jgi:hypothetical protein